MIKHSSLVFYVCFSLFFALTHADVVPEVTGANSSDSEVFSFVVSIKLKTGKFYCGGSIISDRHILTSARCVNPNNHIISKPENLVVGFGSANLDDQKTVEVDKITVRSGYEMPSAENDMAILRLKRPLEFTPTVQPIDFNYTGSLDHKSLVGVAWGNINDESIVHKTLLHLSKPTISMEDCKKRIPREVWIGPGAVCLDVQRGWGTCFGDAGSPLLYLEGNKYHLVGIVSWGYRCSYGFPDVHVRTSFYIDWIKENML